MYRRYECDNRDPRNARCLLKRISKGVHLTLNAAELSLFDAEEITFEKNNKFKR